MDNIIEIIDIFFDLNKPCPEKIKNCKYYRKKYESEFMFLSGGGPVCGDCSKRRLRNQYITIIKNNIK